MPVKPAFRLPEPAGIAVAAMTVNGGTMNKRNSFLNRLCYFSIFCLAVALVALAWGSVAFCAEVHDAARNGDVGQVDALLKGNPGLAFSRDASGWTPLHDAAAFGRRNAAELLLAHNADVNAKDNKGLTPLHYAAIKGYRDVAELLLANKADVNARNNGGQTPLHDAAAFGNRDIVELLLANKADVNAKDNNGQTPLGWAKHEGHSGLADWLRQHGGYE